MHNQTYLFKRGAVYYLRIRVPKDVQHFFPAQKVIKHSLLTRDRREAIKRLRIALDRVEAEFEHYRQINARNSGGQPTTVIYDLNDQVIERVCNSYKADFLGGNDEVRLAGLSEEQLEEEKARLREMEQVLRPAVARSDPAPIEQQMRDYLSLINVTVDECDEKNIRRLAQAFLNTAAQVNHILLERSDGVPVTTSSIIPPEAPVFRVNQGEVTDSLETLFNEWNRAVKDRPVRTVNEVKQVIDDFTEFTERRPAKLLRRADFIAYRDSLLKEDAHYKTVKKKLSFLTTVLQYAVDNEKLDHNPAARLKVLQPKVQEVARLPYDAADLQKIFASPLYTRRARPKGGGGEAAVWLPLLALFTGARLEELGQLLVSDIQHHGDQEWYIQINDFAAGKRVKTSSSRRRVPLHPTLIKAGLIHYRDRLMKRGETRLFPALKEDCKGDLTGNWSKWWGRYARIHIDIQDERKVYHSFRHTFKDICRESGIHEDIHDAITGHAGGGVGRGYGDRQYPLKKLFEAIKKIEFSGLDIPVIEKDG